MQTIKTEFLCHDAANQWAEEQGFTVIMSSKTNDGFVELKVI
jgi:hypothetical protein